MPDIAWILHQWHQDRPLTAHHWDSDRGLRATIAAAGNLLRREVTPLENFMVVQRALMEKGTPWLPAQHKPELRWLGDKKPMQHTATTTIARTKLLTTSKTKRPPPMSAIVARTS